MQELLDKYFAGVLTDKEKEDLFRRIEQDAFWKDEFVRMQNVLALSGMVPREGDKVWATGKLKNILRIERKRQRHAFLQTLLRYAAVAAVVSGIWMLALWNRPEEEPAVKWTSIEVPKGNTAYITLPDRSEAWLSSRTKLRISDRFNETERVVELDGEGFFAVAKGKEKPFIVKTRQYNVRVTGTRFNVFAYAESPLFETDLMEGSVLVYNKDNEEDRLYLEPNEAVSVRNGELYKSYSTFTSSQLKGGIYYFENCSFDVLAERLELWYNVKIRMKKAAIGASVFSGKFRLSDSIELILQAIKETGKFNYRLVGEDVIEIY